MVASGYRSVDERSRYNLEKPVTFALSTEVSQGSKEMILLIQSVDEVPALLFNVLSVHCKLLAADCCPFCHNFESLCELPSFI